MRGGTEIRGAVRRINDARRGAVRPGAVSIEAKRESPSHARRSVVVFTHPLQSTSFHDKAQAKAHRLEAGFDDASSSPPSPRPRENNVFVHAKSR